MVCKYMHRLAFINHFNFIISVQCRIFELIGCLAKDYPDCIENDAVDGVKIRDMYFEVLEKAVVNQQDVITR